MTVSDHSTPFPSTAALAHWTASLLLPFPACKPLPLHYTATMIEENRQLVTAELVEFEK
jgi:hypothetical protein